MDVLTPVPPTAPGHPHNVRSIPPHTLTLSHTYTTHHTHTPKKTNTQKVHPDTKTYFHGLPTLCSHPKLPPLASQSDNANKKCVFLGRFLSLRQLGPEHVILGPNRPTGRSPKPIKTDQNPLNNPCHIPLSRQNSSKLAAFQPRNSPKHT